MSKWMKQFRLEFRYIFKNWFFLALPFLFGLWMFSDLANLDPEASQDLYMYAYMFHRVQHTLSLGIAILIGMLLIRKDLLRSTFEWMDTLPVSRSVYITAKFAAGFIYLSTLTAAMTIVYCGICADQGVSAADIATNGWQFILQYEWSYGVTLALGMALAVWIRNRISYLIGFCAWMFGTFFLDIFIIERYQLFPLKTFHLNQFFMESAMEQEVWGPVLLREEMFWSRIFVLVFVAMLVIVMIAVMINRRPTGIGGRWKIAAGLSIAVAAAAYIPYGSVWAERYDGFNEMLADAVHYNYDTAYHSFAVNGYDLQVSRLENDDIHVQAEVRIPTEEWIIGDPLTMTLLPALHVQSAKLNGRDIQVARDGTKILIPEAQVDRELSEQKLALTYEGSIRLWSTNSYNEVYSGFIKEGEVWLPGSIAWYPLPTDQPLFAIYGSGDFIVRGGFGNGRLFDMHAELRGFQNPVYASYSVARHEPDGTTVIDASQLESFDLLGSARMQEVTIPNEPVRVITTPGNVYEAKQFLAKLQSVRNYYSSWIDLDEDYLNRVMYVAIAPVDNSYSNVANVYNGSYFVAASTHHNLDKYQMADAVRTILFGDSYNYYVSDHPDQPSLVGEIRDMFLILYSEEMDQQGDDVPFRYFTSGDAMQFQAVQEVMESGHIETFKQVLREFYKQGLSVRDHGMGYPTITDEDWQAAWEKVMNP